jgi:hypothetical protein
MTSASSGLVRTTPSPTIRDANCSVVLRNFGRFNSTDPDLDLILRSL